jgi:hypothetical protein
MHAVGFQDAEHADDGRRRFGYKKTDPVSSFATRFLERPRQPVRGFLKLPVSDSFPVEDQRSSVGSRLRLPAHPLLK